ncbi:MAG: hypothetical protein AAF552_08110 [Pseudomonadota bacterium]
MAIHDVLGMIGVALLLLAYLSLQRGWCSASAWPYYAANAAGAGLILLSLWVDFNLSAFVIETCWLGISLLGLVSSLRSNRGATAEQQPGRAA